MYCYYVMSVTEQSPTFRPQGISFCKTLVLALFGVLKCFWCIFNFCDWNFCACSKRDIAESNFVIHEVHCQRNIVLCKQCNEPVPRNDLETHVKDVHAPVNCELCGTAVERNNVEQHKVCCRNIWLPITG